MREIDGDLNAIQVVRCREATFPSRWARWVRQKGHLHFRGPCRVVIGLCAAALPADPPEVKPRHHDFKFTKVYSSRPTTSSVTTCFYEI